jgi:hypothetical protein
LFEVFPAVELPFPVEEAALWLLLTLFAVDDVPVGVTSITTVFEPLEVVDPVAPPDKMSEVDPLFVDDPEPPPTVITVPPAVFVPTLPDPIKLDAALLVV